MRRNGSRRRRARLVRGLHSSARYGPLLALAVAGAVGAGIWVVMSGQVDAPAAGPVSSPARTEAPADQTLGPRELVALAAELPPIVERAWDVGPTEKVGSKGVWRTFRAGQYEARVDGFGRMQVISGDEPLLNGEFLQRWKIRQQSPHAENVHARAEVEEGGRAHRAVFEYDWNRGRVLLRLTFTCRDVLVECEYTPGERIDVRNFAYLLTFPSGLPATPRMVAGLFDVDDDGTEGAMAHWDGWKPTTRKRLTHLSIGDLGTVHLDVAAGSGGWLRLWGERLIGVEYVGRFWRRSWLDPGQTQRLECLIRFSGPGGRNLPEAVGVLFHLPH